MDTIPREQRIRIMKSNRSKDTEPETFLRKAIWNKGYRYRKNYKKLPGKPDIYLGRYKVAIFMHGCFWHRHEGCKLASTPQTNPEFWEEKFDKNIKRDEKNRNILQESGIKVIVVWECTVQKMMRNEEYKEEILKKIINSVTSGKTGYDEF